MQAQRRRRSNAGLFFLFAVMAAILLAIALSAATPKKLPDADWQSFGNDGREQHYSPLDQVNLTTVPRLGLAWQFELPPGNSVTACLPALIRSKSSSPLGGAGPMPNKPFSL